MFSARLPERRMTSESAEMSQHLLSRKQAARRLTQLGLPMSAQTLAHLYSKGRNGPPCIKARGRAYYERDALDARCVAQFSALALSSAVRGPLNPVAIDHAVSRKEDDTVTFA